MISINTRLKVTLFAVLLLLTETCLAGVLSVERMPRVSSGKLITHLNFSSAYIPSRNIYVWLPDNYSSEKRYDVLYMHDGQGLFDASVAWNQQEWGVDETAAELIAAGSVRSFMVVAIPSATNGLRHSEYFPEKPWLSLTDTQRATIIKATRDGGSGVFVVPPYSDSYLKFLVDELKPFIDSTYATKSGRESTFIMGSSMGGLISMYALAEYPEIFAGAACLSSHWPGIFNMQNNPIPNTFYRYIDQSVPLPGRHRFYFDHGTEDLDALYPPLQAEVDKLMQSKGYSEENWQTFIAEGENHSENAWQKRLHMPLLFLLGSP